MKKRIRLTEGDLRRIVRQCVNEDYRSFTLTHDGPKPRGESFPWKTIARGCERPLSAERPRKFGGIFRRPIDKDSQMRSDWEDIDDTYPYGNSNLDHLESAADEEMQEGYFEPDWFPGDIEYTTDDMWEKHDPDWKEKNFISFRADTGPLHRKGSLNRAFKEPSKGHLAESQIRKIVKKVLRENCR